MKHESTTNESLARRMATAVVGVVIVVACAIAGVRPHPSCERTGSWESRDGATVCVHRSELPPPGIGLEELPSVEDLVIRGAEDLIRSVEGDATASVFGEAAPTGVACIGDGVSGKRVQAVYARMAGEPDRYAEVAGLIRRYAADIDYQINLSAGQTRAGRRVRFVTGSGCAPSIVRATLNPPADDSFSAMVGQLKAQGLARTDRKYLVWMDVAAGICGLGEMYLDDRASADNRNNGGPMFARVDAPCWGYAETHELLHTMGGVQDSAPNSSGAGHCLDENDTMCYQDTSARATSLLCGSAPSWQVDCSHDDYFHASPATGAYLDTHWNAARSGFLEPASPPPSPPRIAARVPTAILAGWRYALSAAVSVPSGRSARVVWASSRRDCGFTRRTGPRTVMFCRVTAARSGMVTATVIDSLGLSNASTKVYRIRVPSRPRLTRLAFRASDRRIRPDEVVSLRGRLADVGTGRRIVGMSVSLFARRIGADTWRKVGTKRTGSTGRVRFRVSPRRATAYVLVSGSTSTWRSDQSRTIRVRIV